MDVLRQAVRLPLREKIGVLRAYIGLVFVDLRLRLHGFDRVLGARRSAAASLRTSRSQADAQRTRAYVRWIAVASRYHVLPARCLHRSILLHQWLLRDGVASSLRIGVRRESGGMMGHAWVEVGGFVVNDDPDHVSEYVPLRDPLLGSIAWDLASPPRPAHAGAVR